MPGYRVTSWETAYNPLPGATASPKSVTKSLLRRSQSGLGNQRANQPNFIPPTISLGLIGTSFFARTVKVFDVTSKSLALAYSPVRVKVSVVELSDVVKCRNG
jgi:hypothetical protein